MAFASPLAPGASDTVTTGVVVLGGLRDTREVCPRGPRAELPTPAPDRNVAAGRDQRLRSRGDDLKTKPGATSSSTRRNGRQGPGIGSVRGPSRAAASSPSATAALPVARRHIQRHTLARDIRANQRPWDPADPVKGSSGPIRERLDRCTLQRTVASNHGRQYHPAILDQDGRGVARPRARQLLA